MTEVLITPALTDIAPRRGRILVLHAPAVDLRLAWARWHQPAGLLQISTVLQQRECDVRFLDCLQPDQGKRIGRRKVGTLLVEGYELNLWHFGMLVRSRLTKALTSFKTAAVSKTGLC